MSRIVRRVLPALLICLFLASCQMSVRLTTHVDADGSGAFTLQMTADKELRDQMAASSAATPGFAAVEEMFDGLRANGWTVTESEPSGGLAMTATKRFKDAEEFKAVLGDVKAAPAGAPRLGDVGLDLTYDNSTSFLHERSAFSGTFDTSKLKLDRDIVRAVQGLVKFEIRAELPGDVTVKDARGSIVKSGAVWRPELGGSIRFDATSSSLRAGSLMMILLPSLALLVAMGWFAFGRRRHEDTPEAEPARTAPVYRTFQLEPIDHTIVLDQAEIEPIVLDPAPIALEKREPVATTDD